MTVFFVHILVAAWYFVTFSGGVATLELSSEISRRI